VLLRWSSAIKLSCMDIRHDQHQLPITVCESHPPLKHLETNVVETFTAIILELIRQEDDGHVYFRAIELVRRR
jgi:hypothetical protein